MYSGHALQSVTSRLRPDVVGSASREPARVLLPWEGRARARETGHRSSRIAVLVSSNVRYRSGELPMPATQAVSACPISADLDGTPSPSPDTLAYSLTLPAAPA